MTEREKGQLHSAVATRGLQVAPRIRRAADREIRKQKRRRCLAMAGRCDDKATIYRLLIDGESIKINPCPYFIKRYRKEKELFEKWRKRWLEIADKFKEAV